MDVVPRRQRPVAFLALSLALGLASPLSLQARSGPQASQATHEPPMSRAVPAKPAAHRQVGSASYDHPRFSGRTMADGTRMRPGSDSAASRALPLGTVARVKNLHNGRTALVTIRDRGPHAKGRVIDVSTGVARQLGMTRSGTARVEVVALRPPPVARQRPADRRGGRRSTQGTCTVAPASCAGFPSRWQPSAPLRA